MAEAALVDRGARIGVNFAKLPDLLRCSEVTLRAIRRHPDELNCPSGVSLIHRT
jgi:hypothetical protein